MKQSILPVILLAIIIYTFWFADSGIDHHFNAQSYSEEMARKMRLAEIDAQEVTQAKLEKDIAPVMSEVKSKIESRTDIGILMRALDVTHPVMTLNVYVRSDWKKISYKNRLEGLKKICDIWLGTKIKILPTSPVVKIIEGGEEYKIKIPRQGRIPAHYQLREAKTWDVGSCRVSKKFGITVQMNE